MMKLKNIDDNRELTKTLITYWDHDPGCEDLLDHCRISSNAIYPFKQGGEVRLIRYGQTDEKTREDLLGELDYLAYLGQAGLPVVEAVPMKDGKFVLTTNTQWGAFHATAFKKVSGIRTDQLDLTDDLIKALGEHLAKLHKATEGYQPKSNLRPNFFERLEWMANTIRQYGGAEELLPVIEVVKDLLSAVERTQANYGLVHYDYDFDNLFWDQDQSQVNMIDFDDAHYHFYHMDIVSFFSTLAEEVEGDQLDKWKRLFLASYEKHRPLNHELVAMAGTLKQYEDLYSYARCLRSVKEIAQTPPEWMVNLRDKLVNHMDLSVKRILSNEL